MPRTELRRCAHCDTWERVAVRSQDPLAAFLREVRWSDGFQHGATLGPPEVRCPACHAAHVPVAVSSDLSTLGWCLVPSATVAGAVWAAASVHAHAAWLLPGAILGGVATGGVVGAVSLGLVEWLLEGLRGLTRRARRAPLAAPVTSIAVESPDVVGAAPGLELVRRTRAWWAWNHHERRVPRATPGWARALVAALARSVRARPPEVAPEVLEVVAAERSYAELLRLTDALARALPQAGARLELADLPAEVRTPSAPPPRPAWWEENLRRLVDLRGAACEHDLLVKAEAARALGDLDLARRLLAGPALAADAEADDERALRAWFELLVEAGDPRVATVPTTLADRWPSDALGLGGPFCVRCDDDLSA